jgi:peptidoglycan/xylan/chitin deacetylase (PgdA/CDA1 family)
VARAALLGSFHVYVVAMLFPRAVLERAGPWDARFPVSGDADLVLRALEQAPVRRLDRVVTLYRRHGASVTRSAAIEAGATARGMVIDGYVARHPEARGSALEREARMRLHADRARAHAGAGHRGQALGHAVSALRADPAGVARAAAAVARREPPGKDRARLALAAAKAVRLRRGAARRGAALVIHAVGPVAGDPDHQIDPPFPLLLLDGLVGHLRRHYALVHAADLLPAAGRRAPGERVPVALTFDDDLAAHHEHAAPLLARHGVTATAFLTGATTPFWWQRLQRAIDLQRLPPAGLEGLDPALVEAALRRRPRAIRRLAAAVEQLEPSARRALEARLAAVVPDLPAAPLGPDGARALERAGWELGAHTAGHDRLTTLDDDALAAAVARPSSRVRSLAYPHGKAGDREARAARDAGYTAAFTGEAAVLTAATDPFRIPRLQPERTTPGRCALQLARALEAAA